MNSLHVLYTLWASDIVLGTELSNKTTILERDKNYSFLVQLRSCAIQNYACAYIKYWFLSDWVDILKQTIQDHIQYLQVSCVESRLSPSFTTNTINTSSNANGINFLFHLLLFDAAKITFYNVWDVFCVPVSRNLLPVNSSKTERSYVLLNACL